MESLLFSDIAKLTLKRIVTEEISDMTSKQIIHIRLPKLWISDVIEEIFKMSSSKKHMVIYHPDMCLLVSNIYLDSRYESIEILSKEEAIESKKTWDYVFTNDLSAFPEGFCKGIIFEKARIFSYKIEDVKSVERIQISLTELGDCCNINCPICFSECKSAIKIKSCFDSHAVCSKCIEKLIPYEKCVMCRSSYKGHGIYTNTELEKIIEKTREKYGNLKMCVVSSKSHVVVKRRYPEIDFVHPKFESKINHELIIQLVNKNHTELSLSKVRFVHMCLVYCY